MSITIKNISWDRALKELEAIHQQEKNAKWRRIRSNACSLSALFTQDFSKAVHRIGEAIQIEPLNPLHQYRLALLYMRFAQWDQALGLLDKMAEQMPNFASILYLRGLIALRIGEIKRAVNIANEIIMIKPNSRRCLRHNQTIPIPIKNTSISHNTL